MCEEKKRLAAEYEATTARFAESVRELNRKMGSSPKSEYDRLQRASDEARVKSEGCALSPAYPKVPFVTGMDTAAHALVSFNGMFGVESDT